MKSALLHFIVNKTPVEEASANPIKTASNIQYDHLTEKQKKLYDEEEARRQFNLWHYDY